MWYEKLKLCSSLWLHDIKANYLQNSDQSIDNMIRLCRKQKIKILVLLKESWFTAGKVKVWDIIRNTESDEALDKIHETITRVLNSIKSHVEKDIRRAQSNKIEAS